MSIKALLLFPILLLPSLLVAPSAASTINVNSGGNVAGAIGSANSGDTVQFGPGTFNINSPVTIHSGVTVIGSGVNATHIIFKLDGGDDSSYGFVIDGNAQDVSIAQLDLVSNHGLIAMDRGSGYKNISISRNNLQYGGGQFTDGTLVFGITGTVANDGLEIVHNYFHDSPNSCRNWCVWFASNARFEYNLFYNITDGGQIDSPGEHVSFSYNYGTHMHRMGQEVSIQSDTDFTCMGNVFYDYVNPYYDTEGVSIVGGTGPVNITDNFFMSSIASGSSWGPADSGGANRFGYAIECTGHPCHVSGNTISGTWAEIVSSDIQGANVTENIVFGHGMWGNFMGEPGPAGFGSVKASGNSVNRNDSQPKPPANAHAGPRLHSN